MSLEALQLTGQNVRKGKGVHTSAGLTPSSSSSFSPLLLLSWFVAALRFLWLPGTPTYK